MTTMQMNAQIQQNLSILKDDEGMMRRVANYLQRLVKQKQKEEEEYISKEEILAGIDRGLQEMNARKLSGKKAKTLEALINEL